MLGSHGAIRVRMSNDLVVPLPPAVRQPALPSPVLLLLLLRLSHAIRRDGWKRKLSEPGPGVL